MICFLFEEGGPVFKIDHPRYQEKLILPYLYGAPKSDAMKLVGEGGTMSPSTLFMRLPFSAWKKIVFLIASLSPMPLWK